MFRCSICADGMLKAEQVYSTLCGHIFHKSCLSTWLQSNNNCPQCRKSFIKKNKYMKVVYHRVYIPDQITNKSDLEDKVEDIAVKLEMLKKEKEDIEKKLKLKTRDYQNLLNRKKKASVVIEGDKIKFKKIKTEELTPEEQAEKLNKTLQALRALQPKSKQQIRRNERTKKYFNDKKERKKQELLRQKEQQAQAAAAVNSG